MPLPNAGDIDRMEWAIVYFLFGAVFGSFLNVCIYRFPREESIVWPGSHCPSCGKPIRARDNIPLLGWVLLRGKCRDCKASIPFRYFGVELATALVWTLFALYYGNTWMTAAGILLFTILIGITATDLETGYIPDLFTLPGMAAGLLFSALAPALQGQEIWHQGLWRSAAGLFLGGGILLLTGILGNWIYKKDSMGGGDIKLIAMLGAFLGMKNVMLVFLLGPILALPFALYVKLARKKETIPYGPFLALAGAWLFFYGNQTWDFFFAIP